MKINAQFKPPKSPLILFDGVCNLCSHWVQFVIKRDPKAAFSFASLQSDVGAQFLKSNGQGRGELTSIILVQNGEYFMKSSAVLRIFKDLHFLWPLMMIFIIVPPFIRDFVYEWVARNRYRWFGQKNECWIPSPDLKKRFL